MGKNINKKNKYKLRGKEEGRMKNKKHKNDPFQS